MIIGILSDIHLETGKGILTIPECDLLIIAGDVTNQHIHLHPKNYAKKLNDRNRDFFADCTSKAEKVVIVPGNHDFYGGELGDVSKLRSLLDVYSNVEILTNNWISYGDVSIFGATLWTDFNRNNPVIMQKCFAVMNDYNFIHRGHRYITPDDVIEENATSRSALNSFLSMEHRYSIVVTHHAPSWVCVSPEYASDDVSYAYANMGLDDLIFDSGPDLWVHGHMHTRHDFMHGDTRIVCNARGYWGQERITKTASVKLIEI